jgi:hypothetical protein
VCSSDLNVPFWEHPELLLEPGKLKDLFERIETYVDDDHLVRSLLKCRECGAFYFHEFYEWIDWEDGNDPQYSTYIPVETDEEINALKTASPFGLLGFSPRLQRDFPKDATVLQNCFLYCRSQAALVSACSRSASPMSQAR